MKRPRSENRPGARPGLCLIGVALGLAICGGPAHADAEFPWAQARSTQCFALRLKPHQDLMSALRQFAKQRDLRAGFIASCAGSVERASVRYANQPAASHRDGHFEIVSLSGTLTREGAHLHIGLADSTGQSFGGHLMEGTLIYTTAEIVVGELEGVDFAREPDSTYGYRELAPRPRAGGKPR